jgi:hypothetical protein
MGLLFVKIRQNEKNISAEEEKTGCGKVCRI